jgi:small-conductance mechanosensitive channel
MRRIALIIGAFLILPALGQDEPPDPLEAARQQTRELEKAAADLGERRGEYERRINKAKADLQRPEEDLARLRAAYAGGDDAPRPPTKDEVLVRLQELKRLTDRELHEARIARLNAEKESIERTRERAASGLALLDQTLEELRARAPDVPAEDWERLERNRRQALTTLRAAAEEALADVATLSSLHGRRYETLRKTLYLLRNENLFLRGDSYITADALRAGADDLRDLPQGALAVSRAIGRYLADPDHRGGLLRWGGLYLLAALILFLVGRWVRARRARVAADATSLRARALRVASRLFGAASVAALVFLAPFFAGRVLPDIPAAATLWLRDLGFVLGGYWMARALVLELFVGHGEEPPLLDLDPSASRRLALGLRLILVLSLLFLPVLFALTAFGHPNRGVIEFLRLVYEGLIGLMLLVLLRRRFLLKLVPDRDTRGVRFVRLLIRWVQPVAFLLVPVLWLLAALRYDILAGLITRFATAAVVVAIAAGLLYRLGRTLVGIWLGSIYPGDRGPAAARRHDAASGGVGFVFAVLLLFVSLAAFLSLAGSDLDEMRAFFDVPLPLQGAEGRVVTWWNVIVGVALLMFFLALTKHVKAVLRELMLPRTKLDPGVQYTTTMLIGYVLIGAGVYFGISQIFDLTNLGYIVAALSVGIGFGLQEIISNFVSGLILLFERPLKVGDLVTVGDQMGVVKNINIRATTVLTNDNVYLLVPNRDFIGQTVTNWAHKDPKMRLHVGVGVSYGSDTALVKKVLLEVGGAHDAVLKYPAPDVFFVGFGDSSLNFELLVWIADPPRQRRISSELCFAIFDAFNENDIEIPFPQRDLHLRSAEVLPVSTTQNESKPE